MLCHVMLRQIHCGAGGVHRVDTARWHGVRAARAPSHQARGQRTAPARAAACLRLLQPAVMVASWCPLRWRTGSRGYPSGSAAESAGAPSAAAPSERIPSVHAGRHLCCGALVASAPRGARRRGRWATASPPTRQSPDAVRTHSGSRHQRGNGSQQIVSEAVVRRCNTAPLRSDVSR